MCPYATFCFKRQTTLPSCVDVELTKLAYSVHISDNAYKLVKQTHFCTFHSNLVIPAMDMQQHKLCRLFSWSQDSTVFLLYVHMCNSPMPIWLIRFSSCGLEYVQIRQVCNVPENEAEYPHGDQALYSAQTILCITHITLEQISVHNASSLHRSKNMILVKGLGEILATFQFTIKC